MDKIIKKIVAIDEQALSIKKKTDKIIQNNKKNLKKELDKIQEEMVKNAKDEAESKYAEIISKGERNSEDITTQGNEKYKKIEDMYERKKPKLQNMIFDKIFKESNNH
ncbi:hypothetical protein [Sporosalibacterium faouarense]|uniref:hypothetical protein n=1 Tax=Sporosalibacterium faouarense TaxID=516123 RepID=UPI00141C969F|nr:hypothetical protein [Sporosalibacterium faouarense]MTI48773.1 hypothetical protein [Bacillota bacterium]